MTHKDSNKNCSQADTFLKTERKKEKKRQPSYKWYNFTTSFDKQMKMKSRVRRTFSLFFMLAALLVPLLLQALASHSRASATETGTHGYKEHCSGENGEEFKMEYETSRRFLAVQKFLSPGVLKRDLPVCKGPRGKPYGISCLPPPSNPRYRACSKIYRCRA
ncbi:unnamed protein product [Prunus armeniaca]